MNRKELALSCTLSLQLLLLISVVGCNSDRKKGSPTNLHASQSIELKNQKGPVTMLVRLRPKQPRLSDLVDLEIEIDAEADVVIVPPVFGQAVGDFLVRDYSERSPIKPSDPSKPNRRVFHYQLEPVHTGVHLIRSVAIEFVDNREKSDQKGQSSWIESEPIEVKITSELGDEVPNLSDLQPMAQPVFISDPISLWWLAGTAILGSCIAAYFLRRRQQIKPIADYRPTAEEIAHSQLASLLAENLPSQGMFKDFYLRLTGIVRIYIEGITGLRAPEQTTEEFLQAMGKREVFSSIQSNRLKEFLEAADMVKYAGQKPDVSQIDTSILRAKEFIDMKPRVEETQSQSAPSMQERNPGRVGEGS